ncbi:hypothetical protein B0J13DRAFT_611490 [Dactylonectria estremocensis]|uniref:Uncharacterized protein n=1 Tax=Dactylonectria estremocensis TaxID=1079267 RepID=A0A9P9IMG4_9HYPO|nr:hypothetical protein B0J13DRAFT_611490 [Dactylonectria estremocensis]
MLASNCWAVIGLFLGTRTAHAGAIPFPRAENELSTSTDMTGSITSNLPSTITEAPSYTFTQPFTNGVAVNNCSYYNATESRTLWDEPWCSVYAGHVELVFWPTNGNFVYPATFTDSVEDYTYTSPSVYMIVKTLYGRNACGYLGPSTTRAIFDFDLEQISTLVPYFDTTATSRRSTRQLHLSDLVIGCSSTYDVSTLTTIANPVKEDDTRCNPSIVMPRKIKEFGYPYWLHCGVHDFKSGMFDPPYAIPTADALLVTTAAPVTTEDNAAAPATTQATAAQDLATTTASTKGATATDPSDDNSSGGSGDGDSDDSNDGSSGDSGDNSSGDNSSGDSDGDSSGGSGDNSSGDNSSGDNSSGDNSSDDNSSGDNSFGDNSSNDNSSGDSDDNSSGGSGDNSSSNSGGSSSGVSDGNSTRNSITSGVSQTAAADPANTHVDTAASTIAKQVVSLGTNGIVIVNHGSSTTLTSTLSGSGASASSVAVFDGTTLTLGGAAVTGFVTVPGEDSSDSSAFHTDGSGSDPVVSTVGEQVISLGTDGVVVVSHGSSATSTYTIPASEVAVSGSSASITSVIVYHGTTLTLGGPAVTGDVVVTVSGTAGSGLGSYSTPEATPIQVGTSAASKATGGVLFAILSCVSSMWLI